METRFAISLLLFMGATICSGAKWSYSGKSGPKYWHELFPSACSGKAQSPIDLKAEQTMYDPNLKDFAIWYDPPKPNSRMIIKNNGHAVQVDLEGEFFISNGGLSNVFRALQFHFHWGHKSHQGSEHLFDGVASPIEMHVVTYNQDKYADIGQAVTESDGLAVLGVMFKISDEDNPAFEAIVKALKYIKDPERSGRVELPLLSIRSLLPKDISRYYRYKGSLTTPNCFESVTWTVFQDLQTISKKQMTEFRKLLQFRRLHHKHQKENGHGRHRRSLTREEKKMEHEAEKVLDELGIKGNEMEEAILANEVSKMNSKQTDDGKGQTSHTEDMPKVVEGGTNDDHGAEAAQAGPEPTEATYSQDVLVNNFRPVQPLNERRIYRSFKLKEIFYDEFRHEQVVAYKATEQQSHENNNNNHNDHDGAPGSVRLSITALFVCLFCLILRQFTF